MIRIVLFGISGFIAVMLIVSLIFSAGMGEIKKLAIRDVDLSRISDGEYHGIYHKSRWTYDARVTVKGHRIVEIANTNKRMEMLKDMNSKIVFEIIKIQSPRIDVVSGATVNTRAFQKAVQNALESGVK